MLARAAGAVGAKAPSGIRTVSDHYGRCNGNFTRDQPDSGREEQFEKYRGCSDRILSTIFII